MKPDNHQDGAPGRASSRTRRVMFDVAGWLLASFALWLFFHLSSATLAGLRPQLFKINGPKTQAPVKADWKNSNTLKIGTLFSLDQAVSSVNELVYGVLDWKRDLESMAAEKHLDLKTRRPNPHQETKAEDADTQSEGLESF